jgi:hypothetical protein
VESLFVRETRLRAIARMGVDPNASELFRLAFRIDLSIKEVSHRLVIECDVRPRASLLYQLHVFHE